MHYRRIRHALEVDRGNSRVQFSTPQHSGVDSVVGKEIDSPAVRGSRDSSGNPILARALWPPGDRGRKL